MSKLTTDGDSPAYRILLELSDSKSSWLLGRALFSPHKTYLPELVQQHS